jgi:hypothetical protein
MMSAISRRASRDGAADRQSWRIVSSYMMAPLMNSAALGDVKRISR